MGPCWPISMASAPTQQCNSHGDFLVSICVIRTKQRAAQGIGRWSENVRRIIAVDSRLLSKLPCTFQASGLGTWAWIEAGQADIFLGLIRMLLSHNAAGYPCEFSFFSSFLSHSLSPRSDPPFREPLLLLSHSSSWAKTKIVPLYFLRPWDCCRLARPTDITGMPSTRMYCM